MNYIQAQKPVVIRKYFHLGFHFNGIPLTTELEPIFASFAEDWIRYANNNWLVWTHYDVSQIQSVLIPKLNPNDQLLILEIKENQNLGGWLPQWIWDWLYMTR